MDLLELKKAYKLEKILFASDGNLQIDFLCDNNINVKFSGNKIWKLKHNLITAKSRKFRTLLTFGGAFSNHIAAVATAGNLLNFNTIGVIRGEIFFPLNKTLEYAKGQGMEFFPISRREYRQKSQKEFLDKLSERFDNPYIIPEGGTNLLALEGCAELMKSIPNEYDFVCVACGTGGTIAGLIAGSEGKGQILGFPALKGGDFLQDDIQQLLDDYDCNYENWQLVTGYHFGGYAKFKPQLIEFINQFKQIHDIQLEPIYTGKMVFGVMDLIQKDFFPKGSRILVIHTGGLQGIEGFNERFGDLLKVSSKL